MVSRHATSRSPRPRRSESPRHSWAYCGWIESRSRPPVCRPASREAVTRICDWARASGYGDRVEVLGFVDDSRSADWIVKSGARVMNLLTKGSEKHLPHPAPEDPEGAPERHPAYRRLRPGAGPRRQRLPRGLVQRVPGTAGSTYTSWLEDCRGSASRTSCFRTRSASSHPRRSKRRWAIWCPASPTPPSTSIRTTTTAWRPQTAWRQSGRACATSTVRSIAWGSAPETFR